MDFNDYLNQALRNGQIYQYNKKKQAATDQYTAKKEELDKKYENRGLGGFLGDIVGGIGKTIGDVGKGVGGLFGTAGASIGDLVNSVKDGKVTDEGTRAFKRYWYGGEDDADAAAKAAGTSLNAATTLASTVLPAAGAGTAIGKVAAGTAANTAAGALGGVADELQQQGKDASWEGAANRALSGAAAGLATGGLNRKLGNATSKVGSTLLNNKLATSAVGRGALSGAVGGSVGAGTSAALAGQDVTSAALQGGLSGAIGGAAQGGITSAATKAGKKLVTRNWDTTGNNSTTTNVNETLKNTKSTTTEDGMPDYTKPKDWSGKELKLDKKGIVGGIGDKLENISKGIKDQDVYNSLYSKTADKVIRNNSIERLRELGFEPRDYGNAAKVSTATNKFFNDVIGNSGASITDTDLVTRITEPSAVMQSDNLAKAYSNEVNTLMSRLEKGSRPGNYSVKDLLDESRAFSDKAATQYRKGVDVNGNDIGNGRSDLGDAYMNVSRELRSLADAGMDGLSDNYTKGQLSQMLKNLGANEKTINYMTDYDNLADAIRKTSLFEDARQMNNEISKTKVRRNATAGNSKNILNRVLDKTGATQVLDTVAEPIGRVTGAVTQKVGRGLSTADNMIQNGMQSIQGNQPAQTSAAVTLSPQLQNVIGNYVGRTTGLQKADNNVTNLQKAQEYQNLEDMFANTMNEIEAMNPMGLDGGYGMSSGYGVQNSTMSRLSGQLNEIAGAMSNALAAGDISSYEQLADMYTTAYKIYQSQAELSGLGSSKSSSSSSDLSTAEKNQLAKLQSANTAIDELESLYNKAGGGQGVIGGNVANFLGGLGLNPNVSTYNQLAQGLINQIGAAIGKTDSLNTEGEVQRALSLVPKLTDDAQTAKNKLATLRSLLQTNTGTYNQLYGA